MAAGLYLQKLTATSVTSGNPTVSFASYSLLANDVIYVWSISEDNQAHSTPAGWTQLFSGSAGSNTQYSLLRKVTTGTESSISITRTTNTAPMICEVAIVRGADTVTLEEAKTVTPTTSTTTSIATTAITTLTANAVVLHFFGSGITSAANGTFNVPSSGACQRPLGATTCLVGNVGAGSTRACIGAAFQIQAVAGSTGACAQPLGGGTGTRVGLMIAIKPASGSLPTVVQPIQATPSGKDIDGIDTVGGPLILRDINPSGRGDLFGLFRTNSGTADVFYLLVSTDGGVSWSYITATSGTAASTASNAPKYQSYCQDSVNYKVHCAFAEGSAAAVKYHRIVLTYTSNHITGWTWDAADVTGPAFDGSGDSTELSFHVRLNECIDGAGNHILVLCGVDQPTTTGLLARLVVSRTTGLAPTGSSSWFKLTSHTTTGFDVLLRRFSTTGTDGGTLPRDVFSRKDSVTTNSPNEEQHDSDCTFAQVGTNGDLHFAIGEMYYNDTGVGQSTLERFRFTTSGGSQDWSLDASANGTIVSQSTSIQANPCMGNMAGTTNNVWFTWGDAVNGLHVSRIDSSGTYTKDAVTQPDTNTGTNANSIWWNSAISVNSDETHVYLIWSRFDPAAAQDATEFVGVWNGSSWTTQDVTIPLCILRDNNNNFESGIWTPILHPTGVGLFAYPYKDWATSLHRYYSVLYDTTLSFLQLAGVMAPATSFAQPTLNESIALAGQCAPAQSSTATLLEAIALAGVSASSLSTTAPLRESIALAGTIAPAAAIPSTTLLEAVALSGTLAPATSLSATVSIAIALSAKAVPAAAFTSALAEALALSGSFSGAAALTGNLGVGAQTPLAGALASTSASTASLSAAIALSGRASPGAALIANLAVSIALGGNLAGGAAMYGNLSIASGTPISGVVAGNSALAAALRLGVALAGSASGAAAFRAALSVTGGASLAPGTVLKGTAGSPATLRGTYDPPSTLTGTAGSNTTLKGND